MIVESANIPLSMDGRSLKATRLGWQVDTPSFPVLLVPAGLLDPIAQVPLFSLVILLTTLMVWRYWNFGPVAGPVLTYKSFQIAAVALIASLLLVLAKSAARILRPLAVDAAFVADPAGGGNCRRLRIPAGRFVRSAPSGETNGDIRGARRDLARNHSGCSDDSSP